jgi:hypothetical protein
MGGGIRQASIGVAASIVLMVASIGMGASAQPDAECNTSSVLPAAPYPVDVVVVDARWDEHFGEQLVAYTIKRPSGQDELWGVAGCDIGALECDEYEPLVLVSDAIEGALELSDYFNTLFHASNARVSHDSGRFSLTVQGLGACVYYDGDEPYHSDFPSSLPVTATVSYYRAGEATPCLSQTIGPAGIPAITASYVEGLPPEVTFATFEWGGSAAGICGSAAEATAAVLPGVDPDIEAILPPDPVGREPTDEAGDTGREASARAEPSAGRASARARRILDLLLYTAFTAEDKIPRVSGRPVVQVTPEEIAAVLIMKLLTDADLLEDVAEDRSGGAEGNATGDADGPTSVTRPDKVSGPQKPPPDIKPKHRVAGSSWATPTSTVKIGDMSGKKPKLKAGKWYQMTAGFDGRRDFYDRKGRLIGTIPPSERDRVVVQTQDEWRDALDAHAAAKAAYVLDWLIEDPPPSNPPTGTLPRTDQGSFWVSLKRAVPLVITEQDSAGEIRVKTVWHEPRPETYLKGTYGDDGSIWLADDERVLGQIEGHDPERYIRLHQAETAPEQ